MPLLGQILSMPAVLFSRLLLLSIPVLCGPKPNTYVYVIIFLAGYYLSLFLVKRTILQRLSFFRERPVFQYVLLFIMTFIIVPLLATILDLLPYFGKIFCD